MATDFAPEYEYIVVGSGAGGGTLAARLAEAGRHVLLLEAGSDPRTVADGADGQPDGRLPDDYDVPAFHSHASENDAIAWHFFVQHHDDAARDRRDPKFRERFAGRDVHGFLYPRATALGGCTAHNAMIWVYPHNADWDHIAAVTGDPSWAAAAMRPYFERIENCRHRPLYRWLARLGVNPTRHGWRGWLPVEHSVPREALTDRRLRRVVIEAGLAAMRATPRLRDRLRWFVRGLFDPNDWRLVGDNSIGIRYLPLTTDRSRRSGTRERVLDVAQRHPDRLTIGLDTLVTRVLFDDRQRATGVEYRRGPRLYRAHARPGTTATRGQVRASREVILCGGAFNTPQLLMLSGIGPPDVLEAHGIAVRVPLTGVGANLQDRYEVSVVSQMDFPEWDLYQGAAFAAGDAAHTRWRAGRGGLYATNGAVLTVFTRSSQAAALPDLFCMALVARFDGYAPGYSSRLGVDKNFLTWVVLKAHTTHRAGRVTLRSADPLDPPVVHMQQFPDGEDAELDAVVEGVRFVRGLNERLRRRGTAPREVLPGHDVQSDAALRDHVRHSAWGHHACGTCAIGGDGTPGAVLDGQFRVRGTRGLRVVDASALPRIPGFFIASAVYMIGEKAADAILAAPGGTPGGVGDGGQFSS